MLTVFIILFIVLVLWHTCNAGVLKDLAVYKTNAFNQVSRISDYEYLFFSKKLPLWHPNAQNFHYILPTESGLYIGRPSFLKLFSRNLLIPWNDIDLNMNSQEKNPLCLLYLHKLEAWLGVKEKHKQEIQRYIHQSKGSE